MRDVDHFEPALHEAMMVEERDDLPDQSIVAELPLRAEFTLKYKW